MKTFTTIALTGCLIVVVALQAIMLRNQNHRDSVIDYRPLDEVPAQIETVSYSVDAGDEDPGSATEEPAEADSTPAWKLEVPEPARLPENTLADAATDIEPTPALVHSSSEPIQLEFAETGPVVADAFFPDGFKPENNPFDEPGRTSEPESFEPVQSQNPVEKAQPEPDPELAEYPIWLLIKPDGVRFLQTEEEIATNHHAIPPNAFLIGCRSAEFKAGTVADFEGVEKPENGDGKRAFQLNCKDFTLKGSFGTKQTLEVTGDTLAFATETQQIQLQGAEKQPLEFHSWDESAENRMQADEITLQLHADGFQMSAKGTSSLEINPNPDPGKQAKPRREPSGFDPFPAGV